MRLFAVRTALRRHVKLFTDFIVKHSQELRPSKGLKIKRNFFIGIMSVYSAVNVLRKSWMLFSISVDLVKNFTHFRHPTDERLQRLDIYRSCKPVRGLSSLNYIYSFFSRESEAGYINVTLQMVLNRRDNCRANMPEYVNYCWSCCCKTTKSFKAGVEILSNFQALF